MLKGNKTPITFTLNSRHTRRYPLLWFDEKTATQKELRYATNQASLFVDEQKGESTLGHIVFKDGVLKVSREQQNLQKMLSIYHPKKDILYYEYKPVQIAENQLDYLEYVYEKMVNKAKTIQRLLLISEGKAAEMAKYVEPPDTNHPYYYKDLTEEHHMNNRKKLAETGLQYS